MIIPVILCGGSGTRLWPLSRKSFPKQFVPLIGSKSLLQLTLERVSLLSKSVICVASEEHRFLVAEAMQAAKVQGTVLLEPVARNTAAAMAIAAISTFSAKPEDLLLVCPSDHHIPDAAAFAQFEACRSESIDYAVMEHHANVAVLPFSSAWSDVGSWNVVADLTPADAQGNP